MYGRQPYARAPARVWLATRDSRVGRTARPERGDGHNTAIAEDLSALRPHLLDLHRRLLEAERVDLERYGGRLTGAEFLQIASQSFRLAWLRPLSELIAAIDEAQEADEAEPAAEAPDVLVARVRALVAPPDPGTPFGRRYLAMLQVSPAVVMAHSGLVGALPPEPAR
jgi:hypothetical protein